MNEPKAWVNTDFVDAVQAIDVGESFTNCTFRRCRIVVTGGEQVRFKNTTIGDDCTFVFVQHAAATLAFLAGILKPAKRDEILEAVARGGDPLLALLKAPDPDRLARVMFQTCEQELHDLTIGDQAMRARITFVAEHRSVVRKGSVTVKQMTGGEFATDPLEVGPVEFEGPQLPYEPLRNQAEDYYRSLFGPTGSVVRAGGGVKMSHNLVVTRLRAFTVELSGDGGW